MIRPPAVPGVPRIFHRAVWFALAALPVIAWAQVASQGQLRRAEQAIEPADEVAKPERRPAARASKKVQRKPAAQSRRPQTPGASPLAGPICRRIRDEQLPWCFDRRARPAGILHAFGPERQIDAAVAARFP
jgi:hypothetical protein